MSRDLTVHATHQGGMRFTATARDHTVTIDYPLEPGDAGAGQTSLELLLSALTTCCGNSMVVLLNKMRVPFHGVEVTARAQRREEHPTVLTRIDLDVVVRGFGVTRSNPMEMVRMVAEQKRLLAEGLIEMTIPDKPRSSNQEYRLTTKGGTWTTKDQKTGCRSSELSATDMRQVSDTAHSELSGVELRLFHKTAAKCDSKFDLVRSAAATYFDSEGRLYAEGDVDITLGEPADGEAPPSLISINSSGVTFDTDSGVGLHVAIADVNGDGLLDIVTSSKKGVYVFTQERGK